MNRVDTLSDKFQNESVSFSEINDGIIMIDVRNKYAKARICLQGAQILEWIPVCQKPVIWLSEDAIFLKNKSIRGGIPVCWPWFGDHELDSSFPAHGYARNSLWDLTQLESLPDGSTRLIFNLASDQENHKYWPYHTPVELQVIVADKLRVVLKTENLSETDINITEALHTYFNVSNIANVLVTGLAGCEYLDKTDGFSSKHQKGDISINNEIDRVYVNTSDDVCIDDAGHKRKIIIKKEGGDSTIVWNPWEEKSDAMGDMGQDGYQNMLCVETSNAACNAVVIPPGKSHQMLVEYRIENK